MAVTFDARKDSGVIRVATKAFVNALLDQVMPHLTLAARGCGYALAVHGSKARDIDLLAVPWEQGADTAEKLVDALCGALAGQLGRACPMSTWSDAPHGRRCVLILTSGGMVPEIDLSIMPRVAA